MAIIGLVLGNGLAIDFAAGCAHGACRDPSAPFDWEFSVPSDDGIPWREAFPELATVLDSGGPVDSFDTFAKILDELGRRDISLLARARLDAEARQFLVFAYSVFQQEADRRPLDAWAWFLWMREHAQNIAAVVSYNYDLIAETALEGAGIRLTRAGVPGDGPGVFFMKPHGSIDFASDPRVKLPPVTYPLPMVATLNDMALTRLDRHSLRTPRQEAFAVLPAETSPYAAYQWVAPAYDVWSRTAHALTHCVFAGLSYWDCDRPELDFLLDGLSATATVVVVNPDPPAAFRERVTAGNRAYIEWPFGPRSLISA